MAKIRGDKISSAYIDTLAIRYAAKGYPKTKWMIFSVRRMESSYEVFLYEARKTVSKYITVRNPLNGKIFTVRFSNHKPIAHLEARGSCDFFVGRTNLAVTNTTQALEAVRTSLGSSQKT